MLLELTMMLLPQIGTAQELYTLHRATEGRIQVSANRRVTAMTALRVLAEKMRWQLLPAGPQVEDVLSSTSLDLSFTRQPPRTVAHLIAVAAGLDVVVDDSQDRIKLHVTNAPDGESLRGRERLRHWAIHWYEQFLADDPAFRDSPAVQANGTEALMNLGNLLMRANKLPAAIEIYSKVVTKDKAHLRVPEAMLRLAEARFEMARLNGLPEEERDKHLDLAEETAAQLSNLNKRLPQAREAVVLLGRIHKLAGRYKRCVQLLEAHGLRLANQPQNIDAQLLLAECYLGIDNPLQSLRVLNLLYEGRVMAIKHWAKEQKVEYFYQRGAAAERLAQEQLEDERQQWERERLLPPAERKLKIPEKRLSRGLLRDAMQSLELFLVGGHEDPRRGQAFVLLGRVYLAIGKYVEARAAAVEALLLEGRLDLQWRQDARILEARTALALGERDTALDRLRTEVMRKPGSMPRLVLFLVDAYAEGGQFQLAISTAELLEDEQGIWGDRAHYKRLVVTAQQRRSDKLLSVFPAEAIKIARQIKDRELQGKAAEIIGRAYEELGEVDKAMDAYHGRLR